MTEILIFIIGILAGIYLFLSLGFSLLGPTGCAIIFLILISPLILMIARFIGKIFINSDDEDDVWKQIVCGLVVVIIIGVVINYWEPLSEWFTTLFTKIGNH